MHKIDWLWTMKKPQVPLAQGLHVIGVPLMQKNYGMQIDLPIKHVNGDIYFGKQAVKDIKLFIKKEMIKDATFSNKIEHKIKTVLEKVNKTSIEFEQYDPKTKSNQELIALFLKDYQVIGELTAFMSFKGTIQMSDILEDELNAILQKKIHDVEDRQNLFLLFSLPKKESFMTLERKSILNIGLEKQQGREINNLLEKHTNKFAWMGCVMYAGLLFEKYHFEKEVIRAMKEDCKLALQDI